MMTSDVLSVAYIGPKSRTERHRKTKIGTEVAHVTCDSWATAVPILVFLGLSVLELRTMYATDRRQTSDKSIA